MAKPFTDAERDAALADLPGWSLSADGKALSRSFRFRNFNEAFGFMTRVALVAEQLGHHPDWCNVYNRVTVTLTTYDVGGISALDGRMAGKIDAVAGR